MENKVIEMLFEVIDSVNMQLDKSSKIVKSPDTVLVGDNSQLGSLTILNFIAATEEKTEDFFNIELSLTENLEDMLSDDGPLRTVKTLGDYISNRL